MIEEHLDTSWEDYPPVLPMVGKVVNVLCYDDPRNPTGKITLYDVEIYQQQPSTIHLIEAVPYCGQLAGGANESEDPLLVGQLVDVVYSEGNPNRPLILGPRFDREHNTSVAQTTAEHPRVKHRRNGVDLEIDKNGKLTLRLASNQSMDIYDGAGQVKIEITTDGKVRLFGTVELGGDLTGIQKLMTEAMITVFNTHTHNETGTVTLVPNQLLSTGVHATSDTKAK